MYILQNQIKPDNIISVKIENMDKKINCNFEPVQDMASILGTMKDRQERLLFK